MLCCHGFSQPIFYWMRMVMFVSLISASPVIFCARNRTPACECWLLTLVNSLMTVRTSQVTVRCSVCISLLNRWERMQFNIPTYTSFSFLLSFFMYIVIITRDVNFQEFCFSMHEFEFPGLVEFNRPWMADHLMMQPAKSTQPGHPSVSCGVNKHTAWCTSAVSIILAV